jgi:nucleotidyltransferase/DNA polymerase involved in DNA repair
MDTQPLMLGSYPRAIVHIDGDAFFASCEQARDPKLKGRAGGHGQRARHCCLDEL